MSPPLINTSVSRTYRLDVSWTRRGDDDASGPRQPISCLGAREHLRISLPCDIRYLLHKMKRRMEARGFPLTDEMLEKTHRAYDAAHALTMALHYLSCQSGIGKSAGKPSPEVRRIHGRKDRGEP
jgi:hypothetical protein